MTVTVKHSKTNAISDWTQAQLDEQISLGNFPAGTTLANIVLPSDWNNDHTLTGVGTMAEQNANSVAITGGSVNGTTIGATTASTGKFTSVTTPSVTATSTDLTLSAISTGAVKFNTLGGLQAQVTDVASADSYVNLSGGVGVATVSAGSASGNIDLRLDSRASGSVRFRTAGSLEQLRVSHTASAVNYVQVTGGATGGFPVISAQGSDSVTGLNFSSKSTGRINFFNQGGITSRHVSIGGNGTTAVNYIDLNGTTTTNAPVFSVAGTDTNISMAFQPKGTGAIDLAAGSSGVNISNGGTVTAITRTAQGTGYTTLPTWTASAPTTAGGVQATGTVTSLGGVSATIAGGGTGYTAGDVLTVAGGTFSSASSITVNTVSGGVITGATLTNGGTYTVIPANPVSVTGGTGTGATFNVSYGILGLAIGTAGSGYIEQPTVTFSGGGGSGASAYATVGGTSVIKSIGSSGSVSLSFATPSSINNSNLPALRLLDVATFDSYPQINPASAYTVIQATGNANANMRIGANGSGAVQFTTNGTSLVTQMQVSHTASAVNYVQVTGANTTNPPAITAQGSDANIPLAIASKGTSGVRLQTAGSTSQAIINHIASAVNQIGISGNIAGSAPSLSAQGSDTNIDLALTPKGTGRVKFGTYTATISAITGYIEILDSGGTLRRLAVVA